MTATGIVGVDWVRTTKFDPIAASISDGHYSRRTPGSPQFMPPGQTIVLISESRRSIFGWWRPHPDSGVRSLNGLDGWTCTIFRRDDRDGLASGLILCAESALRRANLGCGPDGMLTYVWDAKIKSPNPGYCFKRAGWHIAGRDGCCGHIRPKSKDGRKTLLHKRYTEAGT